MPFDLKSFDQQLTVAEAQVQLLLLTVTRKLALEILRRVVLRTPVRTGRARGNWQVSIGNPKDGTLDKTDAEGGATIADGTLVINAYTGFKEIWLANNLPYISRLEDGYSSQAPVGMVQITLQEIESLDI